MGVANRKHNCLLPSPLGDIRWTKGQTVSCYMLERIRRRRKSGASIAAQFTRGSSYSTKMLRCLVPSPPFLALPNFEHNLCFLGSV